MTEPTDTIKADGFDRTKEHPEHFGASTVEPAREVAWLEWVNTPEPGERDSERKAFYWGWNAGVADERSKAPDSVYTAILKAAGVATGENTDERAKAHPDEWHQRWLELSLEIADGPAGAEDVIEWYAARAERMHRLLGERGYIG